MIEYFGNTFNLQETGYGGATLIISISIALFCYWLINNSPAKTWFSECGDISPPFISIPAIIFALFISAFATDVWQKHAQAKDALLKETAAVRSLLLLAPELGPKGHALDQATKNYIRAVINREWKAMTLGDHAHKESALNELEALDNAVIKIGVDPELPQYIGLRLNNALESIRISRLQRISLAHDAISIAKWTSPMILAALTLAAVAIVHLRRPRAMAIALSLTVLCIIATMHVLSANRSPYIGTAAISNMMLNESLTLEH